MGVALTFKRWTEKEDKILRDRYDIGFGYIKDVSEKLGRSVCSIRARAKALKLIEPGSNRPWTKEEEDILRKTFVPGRAYLKEVSESLGRSIKSVVHKCVRLGIREHGTYKGPHRKWSKEEDDYLKEQFMKGYKYSKAVCEKFGRSDLSVQARSYSLGLVRPDRIDKHFFDAWSHDVAYVVGLLGADGGVARNGGNVKLALQIQDAYLLEKIRSKMKIETPLYIRAPRRSVLKGRVVNGHGCATLYINSREVCKVLRDKYKLVPNKSTREVMPDVPEEFLWSYFRGYWDGDGCISWGVVQRKNKPFYLSTNIVGGKGITENFKEVLKAHGICGHVNKACHSNNLYVLGFSKKESLKFLEHVYNNEPDLFLVRKKEKYLTFLEAEKINAPRIKAINLPTMRRTYARACELGRAAAVEAARVKREERAVA